MSHYIVAVITQDGTIEEIESLLAPFDENISVDEYIGRTKEQMIKDGKNFKNDCLKKIKKAKKKELIQFLTDEHYDYMRKCLNLKTDEDFYNYQKRPGYNYDSDGNELTTYNPDSKWDWYDIGGRWDGLLKDKNGNHFNSVQLKDLDTSPTKEEIENAKNFWEVVVEGKPTLEKEKFWSIYSKDYFLENYQTKENYIKETTSFTTYALLTPDGKWLEPGKMGWWGISLATKEDEKNWYQNFETLLKSFDQDYYITIVDCHI